jgi:hypothetical protein
MDLKIQRKVSLTIIGIGVALLVYMVVVESELGALPLLLLVVGTAWYMKTRLKAGS